MSTSYGKKSLTAGQPTIYNVSSNIGWVIIQNESPYELTVTIDGTGSSRSIPAQVMDKVSIPSSGFNGNIILMPDAILSNSSQAPSFECILDAFGTNEEPTGVYPVALSRSVQVGGEVTTVGGTADRLVNTSDPAGTLVFNTRVPGDNADNVAIYNNGNVEIGAGRTANVAIDYPSTLTFNPAPGTGGGTNAQLALDTNNVLHLSTISNKRMVQIDGNSGNIQLDAANVALALNGTTQIQINGTASGTLTVWQDFTGTVKRVTCYCNNFKNGATASTNITLLAPFVTAAQYVAGDFPGTQFLHSGAAVNQSIMTTANGTPAVGTTSQKYALADIMGAFDTIAVVANNATAHTGWLTIVGV